MRMNTNARKTEFPQQLIQLRKLTGFESGWKFYHANGGRRYWNFTYAHYTRIEKGLAMPQPDSLPKILGALRYLSDPAQIRELFRTYLLDYLGGGDGAKLLMDMLSSGRAPQQEIPDPEAFIKSAHTEHLTLEHVHLLATDKIAAWCELLISNDASHYTPAEIAKTLNISVGETKKALEKLHKAGLADKSKSGTYANHFKNKLLTMPPPDQAKEELKKVRDNFASLQNQPSALVWETMTFLRADKTAMQNYCSVELGNILKHTIKYAAPVKTDLTSLFMVKAQVLKIGSGKL